MLYIATVDSRAILPSHITSDWCLNSPLQYVSELWEDLYIIRAYQASHNHTSRMCEGKVEIYWKDPTCWNFDPTASVLIFPPSGCE